MHQRPLDTYTLLDYKREYKRVLRNFYKVHFAECSASDIPQITRIRNSAFRRALVKSTTAHPLFTHKMHLPTGDTIDILQIRACSYGDSQWSAKRTNIKGWKRKFQGFNLCSYDFYMLILVLLGSGKSGSADVRICGRCVRVSVRVKDTVRISTKVRERVYLINYSLITALRVVTSADPLFTRGR